MRLTKLARIALAWIAIAALVTACQASPSPAAGSPVLVVATTTVFADLVANVGGDLVSVSSLVPRNGDVHTFEPRPSDLRAVADANLLVMNGLGVDDWLEKMIQNAATGGTPLVRMAVDLPGVELLEGESPSTQNPHLWMIPKYAELYVDRVASGLGAVDAAHAGTYRANATNYKARLESLDAWIRSQVTTIPERNRRIVTFHDAFPYYAREYGITIVGVAVEAPGQDPSAGYTAELVAAIKATGVKAIFSEAQFPARLVEQLAAETGAAVVSQLYSGSLGDPPVTSYEALIRWDTERIVEALG